MLFTCDCGHTEQIKLSEKVGWYCDMCSALWDISADGSIVRSPLTKATNAAIKTGQRVCWDDGLFPVKLDS